MACNSVVRTIITSPVGDICISACSEGLHSVTQNGLEDDNSAPQSLTPVTMKKNFAPKPESPVAVTVEWLRTYFHNPGEIEEKNKPNICQTVFKGNFRDQVWRSLFEKVPFGATISYNQLANITNHPKAARAVGTAMKMNPISIIIPCHRVIKTGGELGFYGKGPGIKKWLLDHEKREK